MIHRILILLAALLLSSATWADGDAERGREKSAPCQACHGETGESIDPSYPNLAGQYESYLIRALDDYRSGRRTNAIMKGFSEPLSNQDILDIAKWYSIQDGLKDLSIK